jgi:hypothetical protein
VNQPLDTETERAIEARLDTDERVVANALADIYRHLRDGISSIGGLEVAAGVVKMDRRDFGKILERTHRDRRGLAIDDLAPLARRIMHANRTSSTLIGGALIDYLELQPFPRVTLKPEEKAARLEVALRGLGPVGLQALENALGDHALTELRSRR